ncbi:MAG: phosphoribosylformylglycinamidine synthase subunit PurQ, partial [Firmicutes bacterium]|nr:phosphoribosylformylglycinamidine synthase subunit PurQ [Bacillota bacterium]
LSGYIHSNLDNVPKKYEGLDGTELAISESQERMAVVVSVENAERFISFAREENLEAIVVARVTSTRRLKMLWRGKTIVDISRDFLNTNGVKQTTRVFVAAPDEGQNYFNTIPAEVERELPDLNKAWLANLRDLNVCSQKGLVERFDSTIGAGSVLMPFGGKYQATPAEGMVAKIPLLSGNTRTGTVMTYGYNPQLAKWSPFHGALYAVIEAVAKVVAIGGDFKNVRLTLQEYFEKLGGDSAKWGKPFSALLGAFYAQKKLGIPAIGGKDSMSGTFKDLHVPPTLVAFAVDTLDVNRAVSPEFKQFNSQVVLVPMARDENEQPDFTKLRRNYAKITELIRGGCVLAAHTVRTGGLAAAISKMSFGNRIGMDFAEYINPRSLFTPDCGSILLEIDEKIDISKVLDGAVYTVIGRTRDKAAIAVNSVEIDIADAFNEWTKPLEKIFPTKAETLSGQPETMLFDKRNPGKPAINVARPRIFLPVFPGTNCEYDTARAFEKAGGLVDTLVIRNLTAAEIEGSVNEMVRKIENSQIIMLPGGFSAGDEPDGSGKFIATIFRNPKVKEAVMKLLQQRDGLMLGICNGFQALIKLGLVPYGEIRDITENCPTLTFNSIGRHASCLVRTKVVSTLSPWFSNVNAGDIHTIPISHGEGRFVAGEKEIRILLSNGQVATQYVDLDGKPTYDISFNPNNSMHAVEGITSPDGRILGKMGHSERVGTNVAVNVPGAKDQKIFEAGVGYFK